MKQIAITDFLTEDEIIRAQVLWQELKGTGRFAATLAEQLIAPNMARINAALGQANDAKFLAYAVEYVLTEAERRTQVPGAMWEWAEDVCKSCGKHLGSGVRFMHIGLCEDCRKATKH